MSAEGFGHSLGRPVCSVCEVGPRRYGGLCFACWRETSGYVPPEPVRVVEPVTPATPAKAPPPPRPAGRDKTTRVRAAKLGNPAMSKAEVDRLWAERTVTRAKVTPAKLARGCAWPGCTRTHARRGYCQRCIRRVTISMEMDPDQADPETLPVLYAEHLERLGDMHAEAGAKRGRANRGKA